MKIASSWSVLENEIFAIEEDYSKITQKLGISPVHAPLKLSPKNSAVLVKHLLTLAFDTHPLVGTPVASCIYEKRVLKGRR